MAGEFENHRSHRPEAQDRPRHSWITPHATARFPSEYFLSSRFTLKPGFGGHRAVDAATQSSAPAKHPRKRRRASLQASLPEKICSGQATIFRVCARNSVCAITAFQTGAQTKVHMNTDPLSLPLPSPPLARAAPSLTRNRSPISSARSFAPTASLTAAPPPKLASTPPPSPAGSASTRSLGIALLRAREQFSDHRLSIIIRASEAKGGWRVAAWLLERIFPADYHPKAAERERFRKMVSCFPGFLLRLRL